MTTLSFPWPLSYSPFSQGSNTPSSPSPSPPPSTRPSVKRRLSHNRLLDHYAGPGACPPSARIDVTVKQREAQPFSMWNLWRIGGAVARKSAEVANDVVHHTIWGPPRPTWPIEMTIIASFMRNMTQHSHLLDLATMRLFVGLGGLAPLPADALITPVTFRVRSRGLRGILADFDAREDGRRELQGEWVVGRRLWRRLQQDWQARKKGQAPPAKGSGSGRVVLFLHGGAYYCFSAATHRLITIPLSKYADARVFAVNYRLAPETRFPGPLHDAATTYFRLVNDLHIAPENIVLAGDSAGGGLCLALLMYLRDNGYPLPSGAMLLSPWVDLTCSCDSWESNAGYDVVPTPGPGDPLNPINCYLGEHMERYITHPYASPLFGNFTGLPPLLIQAGDAEVLRDEITLLAHKASLAGVKVQHELYEDAVHVFQAYPFLDSAPRAFESMRAFVRHMLGAPRPMAPSDALHDDVDNAQTRVVRGDGEDAPGRTPADLAEGSDSSPERTSDDDDDRWSWRPDPGTALPSPPDSDESDASGAEDQPLAHARAASAAALAGLEVHRRTVSAAQPPRAQTMRGRPRTATMTSASAPAPAPGIRSSKSHVDISTLCAQWAAQGPANETKTYTHEGRARQRGSIPTFFA